MERPRPSDGELRFDLLAEIAVGATSRVELCRITGGPARRGQLVAVKRLHPHISEDPQFVDMFRDEVWMTSALKHEHVVQVVGWGHDEDGPFLAVELVRGVSLARLMKTVFETGERFSERMVVYLARSICDGLAAAHSLRSSKGEHLNLVHRDLTPGNILTGFAGEVKITDFGLAKAKQRLTKTLTGLLKGQPTYMSPEQIGVREIDGRADIFALGVLLFELFSGMRPWKAGSDLEAMRAISELPPANLLALRPTIDKALVQVVNRCLEKDPAARYQSAIELRDRFDQWLMAHGYRDGNAQALARFVRRNAMRQMRWFERAVAGELAEPTAARHPEPGRPRFDPVASGPGMADAYVAVSGIAGRADAERTTAERRAVGDDEPIPLEALLDPDEIDWGEDGPTLIKKSDQAQQVISRAVRVAQQQATPRARVEQAVVADPHSSPLLDDPTTQRDEPHVETAVRDRPSGVPLGTVVPPDPDAPPLPMPSHPSAPGAAVAEPLRPPPEPPPRLSAPGREAAYGPESSMRPAPPARPLGSAYAEAARLAAQAMAAAEEARRAADRAEAAAQAAFLAGEAALLASTGHHHEAQTKLRAAAELDDLLRSGEVPRRPSGMTPPPMSRSSAPATWTERWRVVARELNTREGMMLLGVVGVGLVLLVMIWVLAG